MKGFKEDGLMPGLTIYTDSVSAVRFFKLATESENGRVAAQLMLSRVHAALDCTYMHIFNYFLGMEKRKLITYYAN